MTCYSHNCAGNPANKHQKRTSFGRMHSTPNIKRRSNPWACGISKSYRRRESISFRSPPLLGILPVVWKRVQV
jgi:hypothetical protein